MWWIGATFVSFGDGGDDVPGWVAVVGLVGLALLVPGALGIVLRFRDGRDARTADEGSGIPVRRPVGWGYPPRVVWGAIATVCIVLAVVYALG